MDVKTANETAWKCGTGAHAAVVSDLISATGHLSITGAVDDDPDRTSINWKGHPVIHSDEFLRAETPPQAVIAVGDNAARAGIAQRFQAGPAFHALYPSLGNHRIRRPDWSGIGDNAWDDYRTRGQNRLPLYRQHRRRGRTLQLGRGLCSCCGKLWHWGEVTVGDGALIGFGAAVVPRTRIGAHSVIGAGSAVVRDTPEHVTAIGNPAKPMTTSLVRKKPASGPACP